MQKFDVVIAGGGHNGLVCATYLAKAGLSVYVVESRPVLGGAALTEEVWPGYKVSVASYVMTMLQPKIMLELDLKRHGLEVIPLPVAFQPFADGRSLVFWPDQQKMIEEIRKFSPEDAAAYARYEAHMKAIMPAFRKLLFETPVDPTAGGISELLKTAALAWRFKDAKEYFHDILDLVTLSAHDYLQRWFKSDAILAAYGSYASGAAGVISPQSPGSAYVLARPYLRDSTTAAGPGGIVKGGMGAISAAITNAAREAGVQFVTSTKVEEVLIENGRAVGVRLQNGEKIDADIVVSGLSAKVLFLKMIDKKWLGDTFVEKAGRIRTKSIAFKVNLAASELPKWTAWDAEKCKSEYPGSITLAESSEELEDAFQSALQGKIAQHPYLWIMTPTAWDKSIAPEGKHILNVMGGHVPYHLAGREWDDAAREELYQSVIDQICRYAPGFDKCVLHKQILVPPDIEAMFGMIDGHVHHGEMSLDQVFFRRPMASTANYRTPIKKLYLASSSSHPGGGVTGVPGHNAAREILKDMGKKML